MTPSDFAPFERLGNGQAASVEPFTGYPQVYHKACAELVGFGASRPERATYARAIIAQALRALRARYGSAFARNARMGMLYIAGHFPDKDGSHV